MTRTGPAGGPGPGPASSAADITRPGEADGGDGTRGSGRTAEGVLSLPLSLSLSLSLSRSLTLSLSLSLSLSLTHSLTLSLSLSLSLSLRPPPPLSGGAQAHRGGRSEPGAETRAPGRAGRKGAGANGIDVVPAPPCDSAACPARALPGSGQRAPRPVRVGPGLGRGRGPARPLGRRRRPASALGRSRPGQCRHHRRESESPPALDPPPTRVQRVPPHPQGIPRPCYQRERERERERA